MTKTAVTPVKGAAGLSNPKSEPSPNDELRKYDPVNQISSRIRRDVRPQCHALGLEPEVVIGFMRSDPEPGNHVTFTYSERAVVLTDPHYTNAVAPFFEAQ